MTERLAYRVTEAAHAIGISRAKAYELIALGRCRRSVGSSIRVPADALREWIDRQLAGSAA